ncbi:UNVERIFIED_CONTAM: hypothetical protein FKN15_036416 [Acipenser sinensis]
MRNNTLRALKSSADRYHPRADSGAAKANTRCPPKRVLSDDRFFSHCRPTMQPPQSYSVRGQRSSGQLTGKPAGARPDYRRCHTAAYHTTQPVTHAPLHILLVHLYMPDQSYPSVTCSQASEI